MGETRYPTLDEVWDLVRALEGACIPLAERGEMDVLMVDDLGVIPSMATPRGKPTSSRRRTENPFGTSTLPLCRPT